MRRIKIPVYLVIVHIFIFVLFAQLRVHNYNNSSGFSCISPKGSHTSNIPRHIHQMFFNMTDKVIPDRLELARRTWIYNHPGFEYTLWNSTMIEYLIDKSYPQLRDLYHSYSHWVRRADMGRYIVLHEFGGIYIDLDIKSSGKHLIELYQTFKDTTGVVLYLTSPPVVSNDFMISKSKHPFMKHVLCGLESANRWYVLPYVTTMFTTGPMYLHAQYKSYSKKYEIELLEESVMKQFVRHITGSSWHQWDGVIIWWIFLHIKQVLIGSAVTLFLALTLTLLWKYRSMVLKCCKQRTKLSCSKNRLWRHLFDIHVTASGLE